MKRSAIFLLVAGVTGAADLDTFLIRGADVYPVTGPKMESVSILIDKGKIAEIGAKIVAPKGLRIVEGKGLRVYPGMIDSGTELGLAEIPSVRETVDTGELGEFMPQLRVLPSVNPASEHLPVVRANGITSVMTFPSSGATGNNAGAGELQMIAGQAALIHVDGWTWEEMALKNEAAMHLVFPTVVTRGVRPANDAAEGAPPAGQLTFAEAKQNYDRTLQRLTDFFDDARKYKNAKTAGGAGFKRNLKFEAMIPVLDGKLPVAVTATRERAIRDAIQFAEKQRIRIVILQPREITKVAAELRTKNIPVILGRTLALPVTEDSPYDDAFTTPSEAFKAGVKFAFGTFSNEFVRDLPYNAAAAVAFGLPYDEALKAMTINAAEIWGVSEQIGSIEKGKWADLMITSGDPLEAPTQIKHLYVKGKEVDLTNKQTRLYEKYLNRP